VPSWLKKLKQWVRFRRNDDAYATTREKLWQGVKEAVATQLAFNRSIWLVAHFPDTFVQLQEQVDQWGVEYSIARQPVTIESLAGPNKDLISEGGIHLVLADLVPTYQASSIERQLKRQQTLYHNETETDNVQLWFETNSLEPPA